PEPPAEPGPAAVPNPCVPAGAPPLEMKTPVSPPQSECNPVGALQELVVQKGWRLPEYTVTQESGPAHRKEFTMTCRVERFVEIDVPPAGGAAGPRPRLHLGLAAELGGREAGPAAEPGGGPRAGGGLRPPAGALGGAELRHQLPRHR
uniref:Uncharacterized protein n=1 Tax=Corvus moneduloides TaxID=1196302 RepID=A0A8U7P4U5_CORMO